jgi:hypothetical protein
MANVHPTNQILERDILTAYVELPPIFVGGNWSTREQHPDLARRESFWNHAVLDVPGLVPDKDRPAFHERSAHLGHFCWPEGEKGEPNPLKGSSKDLQGRIRNRGQCGSSADTSLLLPECRPCANSLFSEETKWMLALK